MTDPTPPAPATEPTDVPASLPERMPGAGGVPIYDPPTNPDTPGMPEPRPGQNEDLPGLPDMPGVPGGIPAM